MSWSSLAPAALATMDRVDGRKCISRSRPNSAINDFNCMLCRPSHLDSLPEPIASSKTFVKPQRTEALPLGTSLTESSHVKRRNSTHEENAKLRVEVCRFAARPMVPEHELRVADDPPGGRRRRAS